MKIRLSIILFLALLLTGSVQAKDFTCNGCKFTTLSGSYTVNGVKCTEVRLKGYGSSQSVTVDLKKYFTYDKKNYIVSSVADKAFKDNKTIKYIYLPKSINNIGEEAFSGCSNLQQVTMEDGTNKLTIEEKAFYQCTGLTSVRLPLQTYKIEDYAFFNCNKAVFSNGLGTNDNNNLVEIGDYAFYNCQKLNFNETHTNLESVGDYAFFQCCSLLQFYFAKKLKIGKYVFAYSGLNWIYWNGFERDNIPEYTFAGCSSLRKMYKTSSGNWYETMIIPDVITTINANAFQGTALTKIRTCCKNFGSNCFKSCTSLTYLEFGSTKKISIGNSAFEGCSSLEELHFQLKEQCISTLSDRAFYNCTKLKTLTNFFGTCTVLEKIGANAFYKCEQLPSLMYSWYSLKEIGAYAFYGCKNMKSFYAGGYLKTIGNYAFYGSGLQYFSVLSQAPLETIGEYAFYKLTNLQCDAFPNKVKTIGKYAFAYCSSLKNFCGTENNSLNTVGSYAFAHCTKLENFRFPSSITTISDYAFYDTPGLKWVIMERTGDPLTITTTTFRGGDSSGTKPKAYLILKETNSNRVTKYKNATGWKDFTIYSGDDVIETNSGWSVLYSRD